MQQFYKCTTVLEPLLGSGLSATREVLLEAVFSTGPTIGYFTRSTDLSLVSAVQCSGASWLGSERVSDLENCCSDAIYLQTK
jgi:hypothetical protein